MMDEDDDGPWGPEGSSYEDQHQHPSCIRAMQAILYRKLQEGTLSSADIKGNELAVHLDTRVFLCRDCIDLDDFHPWYILDQMDFENGDIAEWPEIKSKYLQWACDMITRGECECTHDIALKKVQTFHLGHVCATDDDHLPALLMLCLEENECNLDLNAKTVSGSVERTPLIFATHHKQYKIFQALLANNNVDLNARCGEGSTALSTAIQREYDQMVADLLARKDELELNVPYKEENPLLINCIRFHPQYVEALLEAGADPNSVSQYGTTAFMYAVNNQDLGVVKLLIKYGVHVNVADNYEAPLLNAVYREHVELVRILLEAGANPNFTTLSDKNSVLMVAMYDGCLDIMKLLLKHGADATVGNNLDYTPLHIAAWNGHVDCVQELLKSGVAWDTPTHDLNTPLALAAHGGHLAVIEMLLPLGCNVNNRDKDQDTPLMYAAFNGLTRAVELLIQHGADVNVKNSKNCTALWNGVYRNSKDVVKLLVMENAELEVSSVGIDQHAQSDAVVCIYEVPQSVLWVAVERASPDITLLLISAGYHLYQEAWLVNGEFPESRMEPEAVERLQTALTQYAHTPPRLITACRNYFRRCFRAELRSKVCKLPIPRTLQSYITMEELRHSFELGRKTNVTQLSNGSV